MGDSKTHLEDDEEDLDEDDEDDDDLSHSKSGSPLVRKSRSSAAPIATKGFVPDFIDQSKTILLKPREFFELMPVSAGFLPPTLFLLTSASIYSLLQAISKLNILVFFSALFYSIASALIAAIVITLACRKLGGKGSFENTYRVIAYSKATLLFAWLSLGPIPIGGIVSTLYGVYLNILGIEETQQMPKKIVTTLVIVVAVIGLVIKFKMG